MNRTFNKELLLDFFLSFWAWVRPRKITPWKINMGHLQPSPIFSKENDSKNQTSIFGHVPALQDFRGVFSGENCPSTPNNCCRFQKPSCHRFKSFQQLMLTTCGGLYYNWDTPDTPQVQQVSHEKKPSYFPLYWLVNRDPYNGFL